MVDPEPTVQLNLKISDSNHRQIKAYCAQKRLSIKVFAIRAMLDEMARDASAGRSEDARKD